VLGATAALLAAQTTQKPQTPQTTGQKLNDAQNGPANQAAPTAAEREKARAAATRKFLGSELFVESAEHMAHLLCWMISEGLSLDEILEKPFYHPTLEEGLRTAFKHARRQLE
jgi:pyruvate/2-oxoglutarate dehydrogenase complex dihydrolipoamide dehydrogenase (E3) component